MTEPVRPPSAPTVSLADEDGAMRIREPGRPHDSVLCRRRERGDALIRARHASRRRPPQATPEPAR